MSQGVRSVDRAVAILDCFAPERPELGLSELSRMIRSPKSTVHRIMSSLVQHDLVSYNPVTERYTLSSGILRFQRLFTAGSFLALMAMPFMVRLRDLSGETVTLSLRVGLHRMYIDQVVSEHQVRMSAELGVLLPLHVGAVGKAILAFLSPSEIQAALHPDRLTRHTRNTQTDPEALLRELALVSEQGYATSVGERVEDTASVSAPIFRQDGEPVGAIGISGPASRFTRRGAIELAPHVMAAAKALSS